MSRPKGAPRIQRRTTVNVMLYIGVFAMAMLTYYDYRARHPESRGVDVLDPDQITAIAIHRPGHRTITLEKQANDAWLITSPVTRGTQVSRVDALLAITNLDVESAYEASELDLGELGLGTPAATVNLVGDTGKLLVLLGGLGPNSQRRYVQADQQVWLLDDVFLPLIQGGLNAFSDLSLLPDGRTPGAITVDGSPAGDIDSTSLAAWSDARAAGIVPLDDLDSTTGIDVEITTDDGTAGRWTLSTTGDHYALSPAQADYALIITATQAAGLGLVR